MMPSLEKTQSYVLQDESRCRLYIITLDFQDVDTRQQNCYFQMSSALLEIITTGETDMQLILTWDNDAVTCKDPELAKMNRDLGFILLRWISYVDTRQL
ncbi:hypothetical protein CEXT_785181 [Caerostris extrusa]|uniref:Uncharacterized protein n=1 Tax=Caerostris extrusa TaxID=172846 RepID=A0AAV4YF87_CAEEX|nr:hypothetical protein CEXT_785181 [Caerostris extrusa]